MNPIDATETGGPLHSPSAPSQPSERLEALHATAGTLSPAEADDWAKAIEDCERIDESGW